MKLVVKRLAPQKTGGYIDVFVGNEFTGNGTIEDFKLDYTFREAVEAITKEVPEWTSFVMEIAIVRSDLTGPVETNQHLNRGGA